MNGSFTVKITSKNGEVIELGKKEKNDCIKNVVFNLEAVGESLKRRSDALVVTLKITGTFDKDFKDETLAVLKWAKQTKNDEVYREVNVQIYQDEEKYRMYNIPEMFVLNYKEDDEGFELDLKQRDGFVDDMDELA